MAPTSKLELKEKEVEEEKMVKRRAMLGPFGFWLHNRPWNTFGCDTVTYNTGRLSDWKGGGIRGQFGVAGGREKQQEEEQEDEDAIKTKMGGIIYLLLLF